MTENRVVLISGAASGIGRRMAERFLEQGDAVHICDLSEENVEEFLAANPGAVTEKWLDEQALRLRRAAWSAASLPPLATMSSMTPSVLVSTS